MIAGRLFDHRVRGFRLVEMLAFAVVVGLAVGVYFAKAGAGRERAEIAKVERTIRAEQRRIRELQTEVAELEQPERLQRLSVAHLGLSPAGVSRELPLDGLPRLAAAPAPAPAPPAPVASSDSAALTSDQPVEADEPTVVTR